MLSSGPLFYAKDSQNQAVTATGKLIVTGVVKSVLFDTGAKKKILYGYGHSGENVAARTSTCSELYVLNLTLVEEWSWTISSLFVPTWHYPLAPLFQWRKISLLGLATLAIRWPDSSR